MSPVNDTIIAQAILQHLSTQIAMNATARSFVRLEGFSEATYAGLINVVTTQTGQLVDRTLVVRSIAPIAGYSEYAMERDRSATWYRNNLPAGQTLILILNRRTSDAQSLQDIYGITEQTITRDGLDALIMASFRNYQLNADQMQTLRNFVYRLRTLRMEPQLRDLAEFLFTVDQVMSQAPGTVIAAAIADSLPAINLFRCREFADHINSPRGDKLLRALKEAAQIGAEVLDDGIRTEYINRLQKASLADDSAFNGLTDTEKVERLRAFIDSTLGDDRNALLEVLRIDWNEVRQIISPRGRASKLERYRDIAERLTAIATQANMADNGDFIDVIGSLSEGQDPDNEAVERLLNTNGELLSKSLRNELRRMVRPRTRRSADFLVGLTALAIELIHPHVDTIEYGAYIRVTLASNALENPDRVREAASVFRIVYGGIEDAISSVRWGISDLWRLAELAPDTNEEDEDDDRTAVTSATIPFRFALMDAADNEIAVAELIWQHRTDSPSAATAQALAAEAARLSKEDFGPLFAVGKPRLRVPIFNHCKPLEEIGDLDLHHPLSSLGAWYDEVTDLREVLERQLKPAARQLLWAEIDAALNELEHAWANFITSTQNGLLRADVMPLLNAYEAFLDTALSRLTTGSEVNASHRLISQAWLIGPSSFSTWAIMPLIHPLKLLWWSERTRYFNNLIAQLIDPDTATAIIDVKRLQEELSTTYGSSSFPPVIALPPSDGRPAACFLPVEEAEGYELYFHEAATAEAFGLDTDLLAEDENELAARRAIEGIVAVIQDYIETYPFVRDGIEIFLFECRNGALPGMLIEHLTRIGSRRQWNVRLTIVVHTSERGAPLFRRVSTWVARNHSSTERGEQGYFPPITVKVLECPPEQLFSQQEDTDIVILADVLANRGQDIHSELERFDGEDMAVKGYLPTYQARQEPYAEGDEHRRILMSAPEQPKVARLFLLAQHAALDKQKRAPKPGHEARFYRDVTLEEWRPVIEQLHDHFNWIICYDTSIDRFLLQAAFHDKVQIIRYSLGLGAKRQHNLTVSSSGRAQTIVINRLAARLGQMFPQAAAPLRESIAAQLVAEAKQISGDIVLRAAGPGAFLNELIGLVAAKFVTEQRYLAAHPHALITWILLDDFEHWFRGGKFPDLLFVALSATETGEPTLQLQVIEAKCVGELSFATEAADAEDQVLSGINRLARTFAPGALHIDAMYWYDQLYRAIVGNLKVRPDQQEVWDLFRDCLHTGTFTREMNGHTWIFCYDGQADIADGAPEAPFAKSASEAPNIPLFAHHLGRNELAGLLRALNDTHGDLDIPAEAFNPPVEHFEEVTNQHIAPHSMATDDGRSSQQQTELAPVVFDAHGVSEPRNTNTTNSETAPNFMLAQSATAPISSDAPTEELMRAQAALEDIAWLKEKARELERALRQRGIQIFPIDSESADVGPSIVRFKLRLRPTESLRRVQSVAEDLARDLALASTPFIDNVLRSQFVGVDIPREHTQTIALRPLLSALVPPSPAELPIILGVTPDGNLLVEDLSEFPHLLVAGATNSGKSVFLRGLLLSLMTQYNPGALELLIIDPKRTDFTFFDGSPFLRAGKVIIEPNEARDALLELVRSEMIRRQNLMSNRSMKVKVFNNRYPEEALAPIIAVIDEYALLVSMMSKRERDSFEQDLMMLGSAARSVGIHLVLATQRPSADIVTSTLKANLDARIAFRVATSINSQVVLDSPGAEKLLGRGDMLFRNTSGQVIRLQAPYMGEEEMQRYLAELLG
ncbi:MAG TPA: DNA translocase FtsK [Roseiflexaceae bacterium]|nr:DNA translocase FtsK [Roseiflexaceae bacterium]